MYVKISAYRILYLILNTSLLAPTSHPNQLHVNTYPHYKTCRENKGYITSLFHPFPVLLEPFPAQSLCACLVPYLCLSSHVLLSDLFAVGPSLVLSLAPSGSSPSLPESPSVLELPSDPADSK